MDNAGFIPLARRWWWLLALAAVCSGLTAYVAASRMAPTYEAVVRILTGPVNTDFGTLRASGELARTYSELASSGPVLDATRKQVAPDLPVDELRATVAATANEITRIVTIRVRNEDPEVARQLADGIARNLAQIGRRDRRPQFEQIDSLMAQREVEDLTPEQREAIHAAAQRVFQSPEEGRLRVVDPARTVADPVAPRISLITLLATLAGLLGGAVIAVFMEKSREAIDSEVALRDVSPVPVLGSVEAARRPRGLVVGADPSTPAADAFRVLGAKVSALDAERTLRTVLVAGAGENEQSGAVAANLAAALAEGGARRVLLVDANTLGREVTDLLDLHDAPGYADILGDERFLSQNGAAPLPLQQSGNLDVLPHGDGSAPPLLDVDRAERLLERLSRDVDVVIVDAPPVTRSPSTLTLARVADATLLVVQRGRTTREALTQTLKTLALVGANVAGTVVRTPPRARGRVPHLS